MAGIQKSAVEVTARSKQVAMNRNISNIVFTSYILISFYVFGGSMVNAFVGYRTWQWVGEAEWTKFHQVDAQYVIPVFVAFFFLNVVPLILLFWFRPVTIPKGLVWAALLVYSINFISTITIQIPIQAELSKGYSLELIDKLIWTDLIFRRTTITLLTMINVVMLFKVVSHSK